MQVLKNLYLYEYMSNNINQTKDGQTNDETDKIFLGLIVPLHILDEYQKRTHNCKSSYSRIQ